MKKLMTMIAAVATAFGLYAADGDTGTSFEGATAGETLASQTNVIQELPGFAATALTYWANLDDTAVIKDSDGKTFDKRPEQYDQQPQILCLSLSTGSKVIERYAQAGGVAKTIGEDSFYFDSTVKMSVFDSEPEITATDAKLKIWLQENDADNPTATNLFVNGYNCGDYAAMADTWARVTARALKISDAQIGFIVYVDGVVVSTKETVTGLPATYIDDNVAEYGKNGQLFPSLVADTKITGVGFAGMGSIDDLVFTETIPPFVDDYEFYTIAANEHVTTFTAKGQTWTSGNPLKFLFEGSGQVAVTAIEYEDGYFGNTTTNLDVSAAGAYFVGDAKAHNFSVNVDGDQVKCATFADAVTAANGAASIATISLIQNCDAGTAMIDNAAIKTVLDLAGNVLTGTVNYKSALNVMDSSSEQTGKIVPVGGASTDNPAVAIVGEEWEENEPTLTLESGIFDGTINIFAKSAVVTGGKFYDTLDELFPPKGKNEWQEGDNTYKATWAANYWTVEPVTMYTVSITEGLGTTLTVKAGDEVVNDDTPVEAGTVLTISVAADADYKDAKITVNGNDFTSGNTYTVEDKDVTIVSSATAKEYFTEIKLDQTQLELTVGGETGKLVATTTPTTAADDTLVWTSDKPEFATVVDGVVMAVSEGTAIITVASANKPEVKATCTVTVKSAGPVLPDWAKDDSAVAAKYNTWAAGKTINDPNAPEVKQAFLLNCDLDATKIAAEEKYYAITAFTVGSLPTARAANSDGAVYNGVSKVYGAAAVEGPWSEQPIEAAGDYKFFKTVLMVK